MTWFWRLLLLLYPRSFRRRYGADILAFIDSESHAASSGPGRMTSGELLRDLVASAARQRWRQMERLRPGRGDTPKLPAPNRRSEIDTLVRDLRYAIRQLIRQPGFTAVGVLSLALAIGANTLIYGLVDGYVLHPFPYPDADRIVAVGVTFPKLSADTTYIEALSPAEYEEIRKSRTFSHVGAFDLGNRTIAGGDQPERVLTALVLDDLLPVLGRRPVLGRGFTSEELSPNGPRVAIISHRLWQSRFGADPGILQRAIRIGGETATVVGVLPPGLVLIGTDMWIPWGGDPVRFPRNIRPFNVLARLAPTATIEQANAELAAAARRIEQAHRREFAEYEGWRLTATPLAAALMQDVRPAGFLLLGAVAVLLLIACANLANLFVARSVARQRELAVRLALGAARSRIARELLTESLLVAATGAVLGVLLAYVGFQGASAILPSQLQMLGLQAGLSMRVLLWSVALTLAAGLIVGMLPAIQATRRDPHHVLKADGRAMSAAGGRLRPGLVVAEIALAVVLSMGAGLLVRTVVNMNRVDPGFDPHNVLTLRLTLPRERYPGDAVNVFFDRLVERLTALPGVRAVSAASQYPPMGAFDTQFRLEMAANDGSSLPNSLITVVTPRYFETLGVPLRAGRGITSDDRLDAPPVAVVNETFARRYLEGIDPVGARLAIGSPDQQRPWTTIVGVVADVRNSGPARPVRPEIYIPMRQQTAWNQLFFLVRTEGEPLTAVPVVRREVLALDPDQPIYAIQSLEDGFAESSFLHRVAATFLGTFAAVALLLAAIGVYGVLSYSVNARTQELGIRLAIGAQRGHVLWLVGRQVLILVSIGLAIGVSLFIMSGAALRTLLVGVSPTDPLTAAGVLVLLATVSAASAWGPAWRASRIDPLRAIHCE